MRKLPLATLAAALVLSATASATSLQLPKGFYATDVNGQPVSVHASNLSLDAGKQVVTLRYANPYIGHRNLHETVVSKPIYVVFTADGQSNYNLNADIPYHLKDAKAFAQKPQFTIQQDDQQVAYQAYIGNGAVTALLAD
ncbi:MULTISPECIES: DUF2057 family protein [Ferrimonas]|uniref:DUF2057 family protein n=1 Tax=Ferrimonas TaxID=44011 RepID=UPI0003F61BB2|nr:MULTISPECIES: DUF2057 family protein [Ferrimonas]USD37133.1 DUF2057 family protein [Ferrimonas sp. SCSIO 43195]